MRPSSNMLRSTTTPPGPDARASNSRRLLLECAKFPKRSRKVNTTFPGSPADHFSSPFLSMVHLPMTTSDASTLTSKILDCPAHSTTTATLPASVLVNCTLYSPLPRSCTMPCSMPGPGAPKAFVDTCNRAPPNLIRLPPRSRDSKMKTELSPAIASRRLVIVQASRYRVDLFAMRSFKSRLLVCVIISFERSSGVHIITPTAISDGMDSKRAAA
mmetsp:Transcript_7021/g.25624  ORF Transcript_7021/g.25624 Transcript_7021/m.25624 type:complete len:215 (-) Transcript_7021:4839-5483(-)